MHLRTYASIFYTCVSCLTIVIDLSVLPIEGADVVLGVVRLSTLGRIVHDYHDITMQFTVQDHMVELWGERTLMKGPVQFHSLR